MRELTLDEVDAVAGGNVVYAAAAVAIAGMFIAAAYNCDFGFGSSGVRMNCEAK